VGHGRDRTCDEYNEQPVEITIKIGPYTIIHAADPFTLNRAQIGAIEALEMKFHATLMELLEAIP
jgi:hypothetical protein